MKQQERCYWQEMGVVSGGSNEETPEIQESEL